MLTMLRIFTARSELQKVVFGAVRLWFLFVYEIYREALVSKVY